LPTAQTTIGDTAISDAAGTTSYTYDNDDRLATLSDPASGATLNYSYNPESQVSQISYGSGQDIQSYNYNSLHQLTTDTPRRSRASSAGRSARPWSGTSWPAPGIVADLAQPGADFVLMPGDKVLATSTQTGKTQAGPVTAILVHHDTDPHDLTVKTAHGTAVIHTTRNHLFWDPAYLPASPRATPGGPRTPKVPSARPADRSRGRRARPRPLPSVTCAHQRLTGRATMIEARGLTKRYGDKLAVDNLSFTVRPGRVTGFLGPNGAGKSTTIRMILALDRPTAGTVTVNGRPYAQHPAPMREVGALLEARAVHTGRSARNHLLALAATTGISRRRVNEVIDLVGLGDVAARRAGGFSLGMGQRLGIASALLGDPATLILDEPVNGLDPEGILWIRNLLKALAAEGRTVFVSSHLMSEMALTAEQVIIVGRGRLIADVSVAEFTRTGRRRVRVRSPHAALLRDALAGPEVTITSGGEAGVIDIDGLDSETVGRVAAENGWMLYELVPAASSLEDAFMELTRGDVEFRGTAAASLAGAGRSAS
jgi:ABC-2 type transport system ATP-binding protein